MGKQYIDKRTGKFLTSNDIQELKSNDNLESMLLSGVIAYTTDSALLGGLIGGNIMGSILGDVLNSDDSGGGFMDDLFDQGMKELKIIFKGYNWELNEQGWIRKVINDNYKWTHYTQETPSTMPSVAESKLEIDIERIENELGNYIVSYVDTPDIFYVTVMKPKWED